MSVLHPSLQRALVAYGAASVLAGVLTYAMQFGDAWSLLGTGIGALITAGALRLLRRTFAMRARSVEELELRRLVLGIAVLAAVLGAALFMLSIARWQTDWVSATSLATVAVVSLVSLAAAWRAVLRLASSLEPPREPARDRNEGDGEQGG